MPAKNSIKQFISDSYYHLYNRGVEKRKIFLDEQDYSIFLSYLRTYLLPKDINNLETILANPEASWKEKDKALKLLRMNNFYSTLILLAYCLMPNHFHLLIRQIDSTTIDRFMNSLCTRYSMYFNRKYKRVGKLFQGVYKAVLVTTDEQLLHLTRYIHCNPSLQGIALRSYNYSSYPEYLGSRHTEWITRETVIAHFTKTGFNSYQFFVEDESVQLQSIDLIYPLTLDLDD